ncbi:SH3 domain-containing protein [Leptospira bouyouniensis]|uniref:SH3 domain-containing protein n=1 Tax=Leptospira bouyouniensis TaxID=2484911 RepID=UPI0010916EE1|nr:SH3 domain-containing protein [Leptospira bouyouniensis]TGM85065.1 SH3 domain-containing protein [Leptospira bouyouniensis]
MYKLTILIFFLLMFCKQESKLNEPTPIESKDVLTSKQIVEIDKQCVGVKSGLRLRSQPNLDAEKIALIPYQTFISIFEIGDSVSIDNIYSNWAKVKYQEQIGWVFLGYLNWDCTEYDISDASKINSETVIGKFVDNQHGDKFYINFQENGVFRSSIFGGCDYGGCNIENDFGEWKIFNNLIYLRPKSNKKLNPDLLIFYISNDKSLNPVDKEHSIKENYGTDIISGWKREKN